LRTNKTRDRSSLQTERSFLLSLLENPNILDHESFTKLLWAVFHVAEELSFREGDLAALPKSDLAHVAGDLSRGYSQIVVQSLAYERIFTKPPVRFRTGQARLRTNPGLESMHT